MFPTALCSSPNVLKSAGGYWASVTSSESPGRLGSRTPQILMMLGPLSNGGAQSREVWNWEGMQASADQGGQSCFTLASVATVIPSLVPPALCSWPKQLQTLQLCLIAQLRSSTAAEASASYKPLSLLSVERLADTWPCALYLYFHWSQMI